MCTRVYAETIPKRRPVTLILEPAPKDALKPENLKDGGDRAKSLGDDPEPRMGPGTAKPNKDVEDEKPAANAQKKPAAEDSAAHIHRHSQ